MVLVVGCGTNEEGAGFMVIILVCSSLVLTLGCGLNGDLKDLNGFDVLANRSFRFDR